MELPPHTFTPSAQLRQRADRGDQLASVRKILHGLDQSDTGYVAGHLAAKLGLKQTLVWNPQTNRLSDQSVEALLSGDVGVADLRQLRDEALGKLHQRGQATPAAQNWGQPEEVRATPAVVPRGVGSTAIFTDKPFSPSYRGKFLAAPRLVSRAIAHRSTRVCAFTGATSVHLTQL
jgi:hypothetical protein